jgi:O-antigen/teichoic acid export membrane protein
MIKNLLANFVGKFWNILAVYAFTPIYIKLLGIENFGLISFYTIILSFVSLMDVGLSATLSREFAKSSSENSREDKLITLKTLETVYFFVSIIFVILFVSFSDLIATNWLNVKTVSTQKAEVCIRYMGIMAAAQILINFYIGGFIGIEKQVKANLILVALGIFRSAVVILILLQWGRDIESFFLWQMFVTILFVFIFRFILISTITNNYFLPSTILFNKEKIKSVGSFAGGMFLIGIVASINTQIDKLIISKVMSIQDLGYYTLATTLSQVLLAIAGPFSTVFLPRFTNLYAINNKDLAENQFHIFLKLMSSILAPFSLALILFAMPILILWTQNPILGEKCVHFIPFTIIGTFALVSQIPSFCVILANGHTKLNNIVGICSIFFTIPAYYYGIKHFGAIAAAICWCVTQLIITIIFNYFVNKKYFVGEAMWRWFLKDVILPAGVAFAIMFPFYFLYQLYSPSSYVTIFWIFLSLIASIIGTLVFTFKLKNWKDIRLNILDKINT